MIVWKMPVESSDSHRLLPTAPGSPCQVPAGSETLLIDVGFRPRDLNMLNGLRRCQGVGTSAPIAAHPGHGARRDAVSVRDVVRLGNVRLHTGSSGMRFDVKWWEILLISRQSHLDYDVARVQQEARIHMALNTR